MMKKIQNIVISILIISFLISPLFLKVRIMCKSQNGTCPGEVNTKLSKLNNKNLFIARRGATKTLVSDFLISDFSMQLKLPNILLVNVIAKKPIFAVFAKSGGKYLLLDETGTILGLAATSSLPTLIKDSTTEKEGERVSELDLYALKLIQGVDQMYHVSTGSIQNDTLVVDIPNGIRVILPLGEMDIQVLLGSLRLIYTKITSEYAGKYSQIDLRFKNPIIR